VSLNGIDRLQPRRVRTEAGQPYRIVYTGSFYHDRDPRPFLDALAAWMRDSGLGTDDVQVDFAGRCRHYANISIEDHVRELRLCDVVQFHDWLSSEAIEDMLRRADLLLLLARSQPAQVPNKLFEYLGMRTPILAVVDEGGESARILNGVGGQFVLAGRDGEVVGADAIRAALESAYARRNEPAATNESALEELLVERQFSHLATALGV
jgi:glycosyltransferase involved in cell wall biosynthesis